MCPHMKKAGKNCLGLLPPPETVKFILSVKHMETKQPAVNQPLKKSEEIKINKFILNTHTQSQIDKTLMETHISLCL